MSNKNQGLRSAAQVDDVFPLFSFASIAKNLYPSMDPLLLIG